MISKVPGESLLKKTELWETDWTAGFMDIALLQHSGSKTKMNSLKVKNTQ